MKDVVVRRQRRYEAEQAVADLVARGYEVIFDITELSRDGKQFTTDDYGRRIFQKNTFSSCYIAKLRRINNELTNHKS